MGEEIGFWEPREGGTGFYLFSRGTDYHLVTETFAIEGNTRTVQALSRAEVVRWFFENHITTFVPADLISEFRPLASEASRKALLEFNRNVQALAALASLAAGEVARLREDDPGIPDDLGTGLQLSVASQIKAMMAASCTALDAILS